MKQSHLVTRTAARIGNNTHWYIPHTAGHLNITVLLPDTDPPSVKFVLPNGTVVNSNTIDADVPAGETLCLCEDFSRCGIDMTNQDPHTVLTLIVNEMPVTRGRVITPRRQGMFRDIRNTTPITFSYGDKDKTAGAVQLVICGTEEKPSTMVFSVEDINRYKNRFGTTYNTHTKLIIAHAPCFTGDLSDLNIKTQYFYRDFNADFNGSAIVGMNTLTVPKTIIHHTGAHGCPNLSAAGVGCYAFYGNPNMTPEDYDNVCISLAYNAENKFQSPFIFDESLFFLAISSQRTSASDEAISTLEACGMTVYEMDD